MRIGSLIKASLLAAIVFAAAPVHAQLSPGAGVQQSGSVTANDCAKWASAGVLVDAGSGCGVATSVPLSGVTGLGTGVATALAANTNTTGGLPTYTETTAWTPTDASGASLSFSSVTQMSVRIGDFVSLRFQVTYPSTANSSAAQIGGFPVTIANVGYNQAPGNCINGSGALFTAIPQKGGTSVTIFNSATGAQQTNANLSTATLSCVVSYSAT